VFHDIISLDFFSLRFWSCFEHRVKNIMFYTPFIAFSQTDFKIYRIISSFKFYNILSMYCFFCNLQYGGGYKNKKQKRKQYIKQYITVQKKILTFFFLLVRINLFTRYLYANQSLVTAVLWE
jgi:hypothetical protein